jgi:hypothetical protein
MNPEDLLNKSKEELVDKLQEFNLQEEQVMASMVMIREELLNRLTEEKKDGELIGEYSIKKAIRISFKTSLEQAEELGAIKKSVDSNVLRKIHNKGVKVPGVVETTYLSVRRLAQDENEK